MARRSSMTRRGSARNFRKGAGTHPKNFQLARPMRGGIRL